MKIVTFRTLEEKARGLQFLPVIPENTLYRFQDVLPGTVFHSRNVAEPFEIFFMGAGDIVLKAEVMTPPFQTEEAPPGTIYVIEAKLGVVPI
jgi:hypothetical protein